MAGAEPLGVPMAGVSLARDSQGIRHSPAVPLSRSPLPDVPGGGGPRWNLVPRAGTLEGRQGATSSESLRPLEPCGTGWHHRVRQGASGPMMVLPVRSPSDPSVPARWTGFQGPRRWNPVGPITYDGDGPRPGGQGPAPPGRAPGDASLGQDGPDSSDARRSPVRPES